MMGAPGSVEAVQLEMLDDGAERQRGDEGERPDDHEARVVRHGAGVCHVYVDGAG